MGNVATKEQGASQRNSTTVSNSRNRPHGRKDKRKPAPQYLILDTSETVDGGYLQPHGVYPGPHDFNYKFVRQLIIDRKLAPFYKGLQEYDKTWSDRQLLAMIRGLPVPLDDRLSANDGSSSSVSSESSTSGSIKNTKEFEPSSAPTYDSSIPFPSFESASSASLASSPTTPQSRARANTSSRYTPITAEPNSSRTPHELLAYRNVLECPICFMYYPGSINQTRCCEQPICTECFVAIKRADPHPPHESESEDEAAAERRKKDIIGIISEPACCPFCMMPDFGVTFVAPGYRSGISPNNTGRRHATPLALFLNSSNVTLTSKTVESSGGSANSSNNSGTGVRRGSLPATAPEVITTDEIRPDWAMKLASARARAARKSAAATAIHNSAFNDLNSTNGSSSSSNHGSSVGTSSRSNRPKHRSGSLSKLIRGSKNKSVATTD